jgi:hypothetical protein
MASAKGADYHWNLPGPMGEPMSSFFFRFQETPESEAELAEVSAPDLHTAVEALAAWRPGLHRLELQGIWVHPPGHA